MPNSRYTAINRRLSAVNSIAAGVITLLTLIAIWGKWRTIAFVVGSWTVVIFVNMWFNLRLLPKYGARVEIWRGILNITTGTLVSHVAGWPPPVWLWLPYTALAFDPSNLRVLRAMVVGFCVSYGVIAILDGVGWIIPVASTVVAALAAEVSRLRHAIIRKMLDEANARSHELERAHAQLAAEAEARKLAEDELLQAQKLEAVGRLAAGIAHEINTPVQFVGHNLQFIRDAMNDLLNAVGALEAANNTILQGTPSRLSAELAQQALVAADLDYVKQNAPEALDEAREGLARVTKIVRSMREFAHPSSGLAAVDLNQAIDGTLTIARSEYKLIATVETDFAELPPITCYVGDINQAILNLIVNAAHAIAEVVGTSEARGTITIRTRRDGDDVVISIRDTGNGIPETIRSRIFDPFFTTKPVGKGTGQGLPLTRKIVVEKHRGQLTFETEIGRGSTFSIRIPITTRRADSPSNAAA